MVSSLGQVGFPRVSLWHYRPDPSKTGSCHQEIIVQLQQRLRSRLSDGRLLLLAVHGVDRPLNDADILQGWDVAEFCPRLGSILI